MPFSIGMFTSDYWSSLFSASFNTLVTNAHYSIQVMQISFILMPKRNSVFPKCIFYFIRWCFLKIISVLHIGQIIFWIIFYKSITCTYLIISLFRFCRLWLQSMWLAFIHFNMSLGHRAFSCTQFSSTQTSNLSFYCFQSLFLCMMSLSWSKKISHVTFYASESINNYCSDCLVCIKNQNYFWNLFIVYVTVVIYI